MHAQGGVRFTHETAGESIGIKEDIPLGGWRMIGHRVLRYEALVLLTRPSYCQYHTIPYTV